MLSSPTHTRVIDISQLSHDRKYYLVFTTVSVTVVFPFDISFICETSTWSHSVFVYWAKKFTPIPAEKYAGIRATLAYVRCNHSLNWSACMCVCVFMYVCCVTSNMTIRSWFNRSANILAVGIWSFSESSMSGVILICGSTNLKISTESW